MTAIRRLRPPLLDPVESPFDPTIMARGHGVATVVKDGIAELFIITLPYSH